MCTFFSIRLNTSNKNRNETNQSTIANSGSGLNDNNVSYNVNGIGITDAAEIAYYNLTSNLQSGAQFADARAGSIKFAENKWGICSNEAIQTTNAWYAVGVGLESTCNVTSIAKIVQENNINIYPNPSNGIFTISVSQSIIQSIKVLTIGGKEAYFDLNLPSKNLHQLDLTSLPNGIYFVEIKTNDYISRERIVISK